MKRKHFALLSLVVVLGCCTFLFWPVKKHKVFDCFPFFNEFEVLRIRIDELNDVVDYFVLVESIETQRGQAKPLYFEENKHLFEPYLHKIIHVAIQENHPEMGLWEREIFQRNCIGRGLKGKCAPNDLILVSDLDEIPRREVIPLLQKMLNEGAEGVRVHQDYFAYKLNLQHPDGKTNSHEDWFGTVATTYKTFQKKKKAQYFRDHRNYQEWPFVWKGGWHFSWMGGNEAVRQKSLSIVEGSDRPPTDRDIELTSQSLRAIPIDDSFPEYVRKNYDRLKEKGFIAEVTHF